MIENQRQYEITKEQVAKLELSLLNLQNTPPPTTTHPKLYQAQIEAIQSQLEDLHNDLREYEKSQGHSKMNQIRAVIWDMDGVLVDTGEAHFQSWQSILSEYSITIEQELFLQYFGMNNKGILSQFFDDTTPSTIIEEISRRKEHQFREIIRGTLQPLPGVIELLEGLDLRGVRQAIGSSAPLENIHAIIKEINIARFFGDNIVSGAEMKGKPDPEIFLTAAHRLKVPPQHCLVIEDAVVGISAARAANMKCIGVATSQAPGSLQAADLVVNRLDEVTPELLLNL